jgi:hypothetical protein
MGKLQQPMQDFLRLAIPDNLSWLMSVLPLGLSYRGG